MADLLTRQEATNNTTAEDVLRCRQYWSKWYTVANGCLIVNDVGTVLKIYSFEGLGRIMIIYLFSLCLGPWPELLRYFDYTTDSVVDSPVD